MLSLGAWLLVGILAFTSQSATASALNQRTSRRTLQQTTTALDPEGWVRFRATYYGGPDFLSEAYDPVRGNGSFGILSYGSCGYTNR